MSSSNTAKGSGNPTNTQQGDEYISQLAQYIRLNSDRLSATASHRQTQSATWTSSVFLGLGGSGNSLKPLTLKISCYHLYYILLRIQEAGFADVGDLDVKLDVDRNRRPAAAAVTGYSTDKSDARSVKTGWSFLSAGATSFGSGWWGSTASSSAVNSKLAVEKNLKFIYTAFTLLPSLKLILKDEKGKGREIDGFPFEEYPGDRMLPLKAFKSLQRLEVQGVDARCLLYSGEWQGLKALLVRDAGLEELSDLLIQPGGRQEWPNSLRILDVENNDITNVDVEDLSGLEYLVSFNLRKNLLITVPSALVNLTSLRSLDLSDNMIDSVLAIYKSLGALSTLNLRGNRISSLCGLERLLSLQVLDIRSNEIQDVSELGRLTVLPHLQELYVAEGNPFVDDPVANSGDGWRINLLNAFLQESTISHGSNKDDLLLLDGYPATWMEKRYLVEPTHSSQNQSPRSGKGRPSVEPQHVVVSPRRLNYASRSSTASVTRSRNETAGDTSPPPVPSLPAMIIQANEADKSKSPPGSIEVIRKGGRRKHRRVVDLDGHSSSPVNHDRSTSTPSGSKERSKSSNGTYEDSPATEKTRGRGGPYSTISSHPATPTKKGASARRLSQSLFVPPGTSSHEQIQDRNSGSGSEVEEFRKKMEKLRDEVGVENWLSVYASSSQNAS